MKDIIVIAVILFSVGYGSYSIHKYYITVKDEIENKLEEMQNDLSQRKVKKENVEELEQKWLSKEKTLIVFQAHDLIGEIEENLYECIHYYIKEDEDEYELAKQKVVSGLDDLIKRECVSFVNIF